MPVLVCGLSHFCLGMVVGVLWFCVVCRFCEGFSGVVQVGWTEGSVGAVGLAVCFAAHSSGS